MEQFIIHMLNEIFKKKLSSINKKIDNEIRDHDLDPIKHLTAGTLNLGTIHLGIANPAVIADYSIDDIVGLSTVAIEQVELSSHKPEENHVGDLVEDFILDAHLNDSLSAKFSARVTAKTRLLTERANVKGTVTFNKVKLHAAGSISANLNVGEKEVCVTEVHLNDMALTYSGLNITVTNLGVFAPLKSIVETKMKDKVKEEVQHLGSQSVRTMINKTIAGIKFPCVKLPI